MSSYLKSVLSIGIISSFIVSNINAMEAVSPENRTQRSSAIRCPFIVEVTNESDEEQLIFFKTSDSHLIYSVSFPKEGEIGSVKLFHFGQAQDVRYLQHALFLKGIREPAMICPLKTPSVLKINATVKPGYIGSDTTRRSTKNYFRNDLLEIYETFKFFFNEDPNSLIHNGLPAELKHEVLDRLMSLQLKPKFTNLEGHPSIYIEDIEMNK